MGWWSDIKHKAGDAVRGVENSAPKAADGTKHALKDAWDEAVKTVKAEADAGIKGISDLASNASHGVAAAASDFRQGRIGDGLGDLGKGLQKGAEASVGDAWHGFTGAVSQGWNGLNMAVHDGGRALKNAYDDATDGAARAVGAVAGAKAGSAFRAGASAVESVVAAEAKLGWGFTEGVTEGAAGMVTGAADLVGGAYKYATDSQYRDGVNTAVEHGAEYVWNHPGEALDKAATAGKNLAVSAWDSAATAVKTGDYESIGKGLGETAFTVATTVAAPEALIGKAGAVAEVAGAAGRAAEGAETLSAAGRGARLTADAGKAGQKGSELASLEARASSGAENCGRRTVEDRFGCFVQGTLVHTRHGLTPIERLRAGDMVLSQPEFTGERSYRRVNETFVFEDKAIFEIACRDEQGRTERLLATPNHPFWVKDVGWTGAEYLEDGQVLELSDGREAQVASVRDTGEKRRVYNFDVDGFHTYYVGERGVWVHNMGCEGKAEEVGQAGGAGKAEAAETVTVFRVEGAGNQRLNIGTDGSIEVPKVLTKKGMERNLYINCGDEVRAQEFLEQRRRQFSDNTIKSFEIPKSFVDELRANAVQEADRSLHPDRPVIADPTKAGDQFGLSGQQIEQLRQVIIQGSGKPRG